MIHEDEEEAKLYDRKIIKTSSTSFFMGIFFSHSYDCIVEKIWQRRFRSQEKIIGNCVFVV